MNGSDRQCAREFIGRKPLISDLLRMLESTEWQADVNWQEFSRRARLLYAQFEAPKRHWWERVPYSWGWWWRVPYGWCLKGRKR